MVVICAFFFFNDTATTEIYTLSLHDALPISVVGFFLIPFAYLIEDFQRFRPTGSFSMSVLCIAGLYVQLLPTILHPAESYVKVLHDYGGLPNELLILHLPQACSIVVQTRLLETIGGLADTDIYFLKHLDSGVHLLAMGVLAGLMIVSAVFYRNAINIEKDIHGGGR